MEWTSVVADFQGLVRAILDRTSLGTVSRELFHDKATVRRWLTGGHPTDAGDVAALLRLALKIGIEIGPFQTFNSIYDFSPMLSYAEKIEAGPPNLLWLANPGIAVPEFPVYFCGLKSDSPLGIASSPLVADDRNSFKQRFHFAFAKMSKFEYQDYSFSLGNTPRARADVCYQSQISVGVYSLFKIWA